MSAIAITSASINNSVSSGGVALSLAPKRPARRMRLYITLSAGGPIRIRDTRGATTIDHQLLTGASLAAGSEYAFDHRLPPGIESASVIVDNADVVRGCYVEEYEL